MDQSNIPIETAPPSISHLQRREIQAPIAACLIRGFAQALGEEQALAIAGAAIQEDARMAGRTLAAQVGGNSLADLRRVVEAVWAEGGAVSLRFLEDSGTTLSFDVTRCRYAEMYEAMGMRDLGFCLSCCRDGVFAEGFNPRIALTRTQTIMEGAAFCDFRFALES